MRLGSFGQRSKFAGNLVLNQWQLFERGIHLAELCDQKLLFTGDTNFKIVDLVAQCVVGGSVLLQLQVENSICRRGQIGKRGTERPGETLVGRVERLKEILEVGRVLSDGSCEFGRIYAECAIVGHVDAE